MNIFFKPNVNLSECILSKEESMHCIKVFRHKVGDHITLVDGEGGFYKGEISNDNPKACKVLVLETKKNYNKRPFYLHIGIAPPKNITRFEWFLEKATEIGIDEVTPLICHRSERQVLKTERLNKILISAMKQSLKAYLPKLNELQEFSEFIDNQSKDTKACYIACCPDAENALQRKYIKSENVLIVIGPEGDFTDEELAHAVGNSFKQVGLGKSRLRTETAGVVACHTINLLNN